MIIVLRLPSSMTIAILSLFFSTLLREFMALHGNESFKDEVNLLILNTTTDFVLSTNRFDEPLYLL